MWYEVLKYSGVSFAVVTRTKVLYDWVVSVYPEASVALLPSPQQLENLLKSTPSITAVLYPSHTGNNIHLLRFNELRHVFVGHGDSDKTGSAHKVFRAFDEVWTAGDAHIDRFRNAGFDLGHLVFRKIGRPNLASAMEKLDATAWNERFDKPVLVYAPTWEGVYEQQSYTSLPIANELLKVAERVTKCSALIKVHPQTGIRDSSYKNAGEHLFDQARSEDRALDVINQQVPFENLLMLGNIFLCDISAAITECLAANAPIFVYKPQNAEVRTSQSNMTHEYFCETFSTPEEFEQKLLELMDSGDKLAPQRNEARQYMLGAEETKRKAFIKELESVTKKEQSK
jgi:hypothetical protein